MHPSNSNRNESEPIGEESFKTQPALHSSDNQNRQCTFKVKIVPKTESGLPSDRYETEAIALSVRSPITYNVMVGTLRAGVESLPENFNLFMKIDNEWTKMQRPKNNENDAEVWDECFVHQPKDNRVLYLVELPLVNKTEPDEKEIETKLVQTCLGSDACLPNASGSANPDLQLQELIDKKKIIEHYEKIQEEQNQKIENLETEREDKSFQLDVYDVMVEQLSLELEEQKRKMEQLKKNHQLVKQILECTVCCSVKKEIVFCGGCRRFTCCIECAGNMTEFECPTCRANWLDRNMGFGINLFQDFDCIENDPDITVTTSSENRNYNPSSSHGTEQNLPRLVGPTLVVDPPTCTVPAAGGDVTFQVFNFGPQRLVFRTVCINTCDYKVNPAHAFIEAGATTSLQLTRKAGPPNKDELFIYSVVAAPDVADSADAFMTATSVGCVKIPVSATT